CFAPNDGLHLVAIPVPRRNVFLANVAFLRRRRWRNPRGSVRDRILHVGRPEEPRVQVLLQMLCFGAQWDGTISQEKSRVLLLIGEMIVYRLRALCASCASHEEIVAHGHADEVSHDSLGNAALTLRSNATVEGDDALTHGDGDVAQVEPAMLGKPITHEIT